MSRNSTSKRKSDKSKVAESRSSYVMPSSRENNRGSITEQIDSLQGEGDANLLSPRESDRTKLLHNNKVSIQPDLVTKTFVESGEMS